MPDITGDGAEQPDQSAQPDFTISSFLANSEDLPRDKQLAYNIVDLVRVTRPHADDAGKTLFKAVQAIIDTGEDIDYAYKGPTGETSLQLAIKKDFPGSALLIAKSISLADNLTKQQKLDLIPTTAEEVKDSTLFMGLNVIKDEVRDQPDDTPRSGPDGSSPYRPPHGGYPGGNPSA